MYQIDIISLFQHLWALNDIELILSDIMVEIYSQRGNQVGCELQMDIKIKRF